MFRNSNVFFSRWCNKQILNATDEAVGKVEIMNVDSPLLWINTALKETRKVLVEVLVTQKRRIKFVEQMRNKCGHQSHNDKARTKDTKEEIYDDDWEGNGENHKTYDNPLDCPGFSEEFFNKQICLYCGHGKEAHSLESHHFD